MSFFLFVIFTVYAMLPLGMRDAAAAGLVSSTSHLLALGLYLGPQPGSRPALLPQVSTKRTQAASRAGSARCYLVPLGIHQPSMSCDSKAGRNAGRGVQTQTRTVPLGNWYTVQCDACKRQKRALGLRGRECAWGLGLWGQMWMGESLERM